MEQYIQKKREEYIDEKLTKEASGYDISTPKFLKYVTTILNERFFPFFYIIDQNIVCFYTGQLFKMTATEVTDDEGKRELIEKIEAQKINKQ